MNRLPLLICVVIVLAGCPVDSGDHEYRLEVSVVEESTDGKFVGSLRADLSGRPPTSIVYHDVRVILLNDSMELASYSIGDMTTDRWSIKKNISVPERPDMALIRYDNISGADRPGTIQGVKWNSESDVYVQYGNYSKQY
jgi:hypothetical protein